MKQIILAIAALIIVSHSNAQILKGSMLMVGSGSYAGNNYSIKDSSTTTLNKSANYSFSPGIGYFIKDNLAVGMEIGYGYNKTTYETNNLPAVTPFTNKNTTITQSLQFAPYASCHFMLSPKAFIFIKARVAYGMPLSYDSKNEYYSGMDYSTDDNKKVKINTLNAQLVPGILFFLNNRFALQANFGSLYYNSMRIIDKSVSYDNYNNTTSSGLNLNLSSVYVGVQYFLVRK